MTAKSFKASLPLRLSLLAMLLVAEVALVASLRTIGWIATGGAMRWWSCLLLAALPLALAVVFLCVQRFRFGLRFLLVAMALVAMFLCVTVLPLRNAIEARRGSQALTHAGAVIRTESSFESVYKSMKYDPRPPKPAIPNSPPVATWLRPLAGDTLKISPDVTVKELWLTNDTQVAAFLENANRFENLERVAISDTSPEATGEFAETLAPRENLTDLVLNSGVRDDFLRSMIHVRTLYLSGEGRAKPAPLSVQVLHDVAAMPNLRVLWIYQHDVTDADIQILGESKTLKYIVLRHTPVTDAGVRELSRALPDCVIHHD